MVIILVLKLFNVLAIFVISASFDVQRQDIDARRLELISVAVELSSDHSNSQTRLQPCTARRDNNSSRCSITRKLNTSRIIAFARSSSSDSL